MRIFDRIASGESVIPRNASRPNVKADIAWRKVVNTSVRVIADEAYLYVSEKKLADELSMDFFGQMTPPFPNMWIEWNTASGTEAVVCLSERDADADFTWRIHKLFAQTKRSQIHVLPISMSMVSRILDTGQTIAVHTVYLHGSDAKQFSPHFYTPMLAVAWMNCRNLNLVEVQPSERLARKRKRRNAFVGLSYNRIEIAAQHRKHWEQSSGVSHTQWHSVRGHLATYNNDKPMFGIPGRVGTFWRPAHARGDKALGKINHEYYVTAEVAE